LSTSRFGSSVPVQKLADGFAIPTLALGVWQIPNNQVCVDAVMSAFEIGYRHIDTAQAYENEESVGEAIKRSGLEREEIFVTTKFEPTRKDPVAELGESLKRLQLDYVDLYLVHWPQRDPIWAWPGMERARSNGYTRSIGVSNYGTDDIEELMRVATSPPVVNQIELSPFTSRRALVDEGRRNGLAHARGLQPTRHRKSPGRQDGRGHCGQGRKVIISGVDPMGAPARLRGPAEIEPAGAPG
jgi:diketogulonate reductase-like aldo/keto reductase